MKKYCKITLIILIILLVKLCFTYITNEIIINKYKKNDYQDKLIKILYIGIQESYIPYYNHGNILYQKGEYEEAIKKYEIALNHHPKKERICLIRVNISLSMVAKINTKKKQTALSELEEARKNLYEDNCADPFGDKGESKQAEQLEEEIKKLEEQVKNDDTESDDQKDNNNQQNKEPQTASIEEKIKENNNNANASRQDTLDRYKNDIDIFPSGKMW